MPWAIKGLMDIVVMVLVAVGTMIVASNFSLGTVILAVATGIKAAVEYLYEKGIIVKLKRGY